MVTVKCRTMKLIVSDHYVEGKKVMQLFGESAVKLHGGPIYLTEGDVRRLTGVFANWLNGKGLTR